MFKAALMGHTEFQPHKHRETLSTTTTKQMCTLDWEDPEATSQRSARRNCVKNEDTEGRTDALLPSLGVAGVSCEQTPPEDLLGLNDGTTGVGVAWALT